MGNYNKDNKNRGNRRTNDNRNRRGGKPSDVQDTCRKPSISEISDVIGKENDPTWYQDPQGIVNGASQISWFAPSGAPLNPQEPYLMYSGSLENPDGIYGTPSVMAIDVWPSPGYASSPNDAVNIAANELFMRMRKALTTTATYAPADVMMYILGIDSIISAWCDISRQFGVIPMYSGVNLNFPETLYGAICDSATPLKNDTAAYNDLRTKFNLIVGKANTLFAPLMTPIQTRHMWMFSNIFLDSKTSWSQMYFFRLKAVYKLDEKSVNTGTALKPIEWPKGLGGKIELFNDMVEAYRNSDSMIRINADLRKAFENVNELKFDLVPEGYVQKLTYSDEVLGQIHNLEVARFVMQEEEPAPDPTNFHSESFVSPWIVQDVNKNCVIFKPGVVVSAAAYNRLEEVSMSKESYIIDSSMQDPTIDDVLVNTRLITPYDVSATFTVGNEHKFAIIQKPVSDFCVGARSYTRYIKDDGTIGLSSVDLPPRNDLTLKEGGLDTYQMMSILANFTSFEMAPQIKYSTTVSTIWDDRSPVVRRVWDYDHLGIITTDHMQLLNQAVTLAMWRLDDILR